MNINLTEKIKKCTIFSKFRGIKKIIFPRKHLTRNLLFIFSIALMLPIHEVHAGILSGAYDVLSGAYDCVTSPIMCAVDGASYIIFHIARLFLFFAAQYVYFAAYLVDIMLDEEMYRQVFASPAIIMGWTTIRDFCNMFFIFFLLVVAFATILRISEYSAKNILPKFLIAIFLINFSMEITKLVIDFGQVFMFEIRSWMGTFAGSGGGAGGLTKIVTYFRDYFGGENVNASTPNAALAVLFAVFYSFMLGSTYIMLAGFLLVRIITFAILMVISPFAFFCVVFPGTRTYYSQWWGSLVKYALFGPIFMLFVYISATMAIELTVSYVIPTNSKGYDSVEALKDFLPLLIPNIVALAMLWAVVPITNKLGIAGSSKLIGGIGGFGAITMASYGAARMAGGWGKRAAGGVASRTRLGSGYNALRDKVEQKGIAKIPFIGKGIVLKNMANRQKEKEEKMKKMEVEFGDLKNVDLDMLKDKAGKAFGVDGTTDTKALLLKAAAAQGKLGERDEHGKLKYGGEELNQAERSLSKKDLEQITNKSLTLATMTTDAKNRINTASGDGTRTNLKVMEGMTDEQKTEYKTLTDSNQRKIFVEDQIKREKMRDLVKENKAHEVQDLDDASTAKIWRDSQLSEQRKSSTNKMSEEQRADLQKGYMANTVGGHLELSDPDYVNKVTADRARIKAEAVGTDIQKSIAANKLLDNEEKFRTEAVNAGKDLKEAFKGCEDSAKSIGDSFSKFDAKVVGKFSDTQLKDYGHHATMSQVRSIFRDGKETEVETIKNKKVLEASSNPALKTKLDAEVKAIDSLISGDKY